jgi:hypothetical protein
MAGVDAVAVDYGGLGETPTYAAVADRVASALPGEGWTVVVHSGAGGLAPSIVAALAAPAGVVFVDAILPHPGRSWMQTAPPALVHHLRGLVENGMLPPWNMWFASDPVERMVTNGSLRAVVVEEMPLIPLAWLEATAPELAGWAALPCAYLQLSSAYAAETGQAQARGWPVERLGLHHLAMITDPGKVAQALTRLITP